MSLLQEIEPIHTMKQARNTQTNLGISKTDENLKHREQAAKARDVQQRHRPEGRSSACVLHGRQRLADDAYLVQEQPHGEVV